MRFMMAASSGLAALIVYYLHNGQPEVKGVPETGNWKLGSGNRIVGCGERGTDPEGAAG
jgi:hypothetical protein